MTGGVLTKAGLEDIAHDDLIDQLRVEVRAAQGFLHGEGAELGGGEAGEGALELGDGGAAGADDYDFGHGWAPFWRTMIDAPFDTGPADCAGTGQR